MTKLNTPITIGNKTCKNRILMPPLVCFNWADEEGLETVNRAEHYGLRSDAETGFIVVEAAAISKEGRITRSELGIWDDKHIDQYKRIADRCHNNGALVVVQIVHAGIKACYDKVYAPSVLEENDKEVLELSIDHIKQIKEDFISAAVIAYKAGLDGVEIHGAHGYLLNQFASPKSNLRNDEYGGSLENRYRLSLDIIEAIKKETSDDFLITYRYGVNDPTFEDDIEAVKMLEAAGVVLFNVSSGIGIKSLEIPSDYPESFITYMGYKIKQHVSVPVASVYGIRHPEQAIKLIDDDFTDMVAIGRGLLADPKWSQKAIESQPVNKCLHCKPCQFAKDGRNCPVNKRAL